MDFLSAKPRRQLTPEARERMRAGQHKGLLQAVAKRKADCSADYATNFDHGQTAPDFVRSAEAAGETREAVRSHLSLVDRTLLMLSGFFKRAASKLPSLPLQSDAASPRAPKLVRALALLLWRPLRLFRTQEHWEWLALCYRLGQLVRWRQKHGELTVERVEQFHEQLDAIMENYDWEVVRRLKRIEKRFWKVWPLYRGLVGVVAAVFGRSEANPEVRAGIPNSPIASEISNPNSPIASEISNPKSSIAPQGGGTSAANDSPSTKALSAVIDRRYSQVANEGYRGPGLSRAPVAYPSATPLIQPRGTPHYDQFHPTWLERIDGLTPEAIADPFQSPSHTLRAQRKRTQTATVKDPKLWKQRPATPRLPPGELPERVATSVIRYPSERTLRRLVRSGELRVPGTFEDFVGLVEAALGPEARDSGLKSEIALGARASRPQEAKSATAGETPALPGHLRALAESLWNRTHVFSARAAELRELLEATLVWEPGRFLRLWLKLLPVEYGHEMVNLFQRTHGPDREDIAWGAPEAGEPRRKRGQPPRPAIVPRSEAEGRRKHAGELQRGLRIWFVAVWQALVPVIRGSQKVTVALYQWAVSRFGIREEFVEWRPDLSLQQLETRRDRPEWAVRLVTATGKTLVRLGEGRVFEPEGGEGSCYPKVPSPPRLL